MIQTNIMYFHSSVIVCLNKSGCIWKKEKSCRRWCCCQEDVFLGGVMCTSITTV